MKEDRDIRSMMDELEAGKARGPPSGSHFAKMQSTTMVWGVKPNKMGKDKDWPMPKEIPKGKTDGDDRPTEIKKADPKEPVDAGKDTGVKMKSPLVGEGNLTKSAEEIPSFSDMMSFKKMPLWEYEPTSDERARGMSSIPFSVSAPPGYDPAVDPRAHKLTDDEYIRMKDMSDKYNKLDTSGMSDLEKYRVKRDIDNWSSDRGGLSLLNGDDYPGEIHVINTTVPDQEWSESTKDMGRRPRKTYEEIDQMKQKQADERKKASRAAKTEVKRNNGTLEKEYYRRATVGGHADTEGWDRSNSKKKKKRAKRLNPSKNPTQKVKKKIKKSDSDGLPSFKDMMSIRKMDIGQMTGLDPSTFQHGGDVVQTTLGLNDPNSIFIVNDDLNKRMVDKYNDVADSNIDFIGSDDAVIDAWANAIKNGDDHFSVDMTPESDAIQDAHINGMMKREERNKGAKNDKTGDGGIESPTLRSGKSPGKHPVQKPKSKNINRTTERKTKGGEKE